MRGTKEDDKMMSPMFPRLHVNDTEKGGPRAPPRNKMALYEQFSIPSQRFSSGSASASPIPPKNGSNLVPSMSSSHGGGYERSVFTPFCNLPVPSNMAGGGKPSNVMANEEEKSTNSTNDQSLSSTQPLLLSAECNSFGSRRFSNFKNFSWKKLGDENDFRVPCSVQSGAALDRSNSLHKEHEIQPSLKLSIFQSSSESIDPKVRDQKKSQAEGKDKVSQTWVDLRKLSTSFPSIKEKTPTDAISSPSGIYKGSELLRQPHSPPNQECRSDSADLLKGLHDTNARLNQKIGTTQEKPALKDNSAFTESAGVLVKETSSKLRSESHSRLSLKDQNRNSNLENTSDFRGDKGCSLQVGAVASGERDTGSETSMVDSESTLVISPDDVVGVLGEKQFWKARRAFVNQQRVFAVQLFELHKLIKVQKLMAEQSHLLLEDGLFVRKSSLKLSSVKMLPCKRAIEQPPLAIKSKNDLQKPPAFVEIADENTAEKLPLPSVNNETSEGLVTQRSNYGSYSVSAAPTAMPNNTRSSPWGFPPPGNQWLVTVMSPSEGLIYKPYTGPCPPTAGFLAPMYGNCGPMNLTPGGAEYMNAACGIPASHQQGIGFIPGASPMVHTYFPPYGMPVMNTSMLGPEAEQMNPYPGNQSRDNQFSFGDVNFTSAHQCSCNMSSQMSRVFSYCAGKYHASKEIEPQGSTASNPTCERAKGDALPLFPTEPTVQASDDQNTKTKDQPTRVIKVVPHNPRSATESAARIFQSIQEERKFYD